MEDHRDNRETFPWTIGTGGLVWGAATGGKTNGLSFSRVFTGLSVIRMSVDLDNNLHRTEV